MVVEEQEIEVDRLPTCYLTAGTGPPMVLLHGAGDNALDWRCVIPALAATHRVYAPDLPGSPDSARPAADYSPSFFERFVAGTLAVIPDCGHLPHVECPDLFVAALNGFFGGRAHR